MSSQFDTPVPPPSVAHHQEPASEATSRLSDEQRRLTERHLHVVERAAGPYRRRCRSSLQHEDLLQVGAIALAQAAQRFDPERGADFAAFAFPRVTGAIRDHFRALDPLSRNERGQLRQLERVRSELAAQRGGLPSSEELADRLGWTGERLRQVEELELALSAGWAQTHEAPSEERGGCGATDASLDGPEATLLDGELKEQLVDALDALPERKRLVLDLYYHEELRLHEIGEVLGVTESRACQLHREAVEALRRRLDRRLAVPA